MTLKQQFPESKGWITAKITLNKGCEFSQDDAREFVTFGKPHRVQFGHIDVSRNPVKVIYRENRRAAVDPDANPTELPMDLLTPVPFIAKCGNVIAEVTQIREEFQPLPVVDVTIVAGIHFNDHGDFGPGSRVCIDPLTDHWRILIFPDFVSASLAPAAVEAAEEDPFI